MEFFLDMIPPTVTAQEHKVMIRRGRPVFYDTPRLKEARRLYEHALRLNRPDTDNLQKLLKDCMTRVGFWRDDAQVCRETVTKRWTRTRPGIRIEVTQLDE